MFNVDSFQVILNYIPYNNWLLLRYVCSDWNDTIISLCSSSPVVNLAHKFEHYTNCDDITSFTSFRFAEISSKTMTIKNLNKSSSLQNTFKTGNDSHLSYLRSNVLPFLHLFDHLEELTIDETLYKIIFDDSQDNILDMHQLSQLKTINIVGVSLSKACIRKLPSSVRHLNFIGVTVRTCPFRKTAIRQVQKISFRFFVGEPDKIRKMVPQHIQLNLEHSMGSKQWPDGHETVIRYVNEIHDQYSLQVHLNPLEGYTAPNFILYALYERTEDIDIDQEESFRLINYCFQEKAFPIEIEHLFCLARHRTLHNRLIHILEIAKETGQIQRLRNQGTIVMNDSSFLFLLYERDVSLAQRVIIEFGFDPNIAHDTYNDSYRTLCPVQQVTPLLVQFLVNGSERIITFDKIASFCDGVQNRRLQSIDFSIKYQGFSLARLAMAYEYGELMNYFIEHGSVLDRQLDFVELKHYFPLSSAFVFQLELWIDYAKKSSSLEEVWNALNNNPQALYNIALNASNILKAIDALDRIAQKLNRSLFELLLLNVRRSNLQETKNQNEDISFFECMLINSSPEVKKHLSKQIRTLLAAEKKNNPKLGEKFADKLFGKVDQHNGRYMAHLMVEIKAMRIEIPLFVTALKQMPSLTESDIDGTSTVFHHMPLRFFDSFINHLFSNYEKNNNNNDNNNNNNFNQDLRQEIIELLSSKDSNGLYPIEPFHIISNTLLWPHIKNPQEMLKSKNSVGLTALQVACLEGKFHMFQKALKERWNSSEVDLIIEQELSSPVEDPEDPSIQYSLFALSNSFVRWESSPSDRDLLFRFADFSLVTPDNASLIHAFAAVPGTSMNDFEAIVDRCLQANIDINMSTTRRRQTALHFAAEFGNEDRFQLLVQKGADASEQVDIRGRSPLSYAPPKFKLFWFYFKNHNNNNNNEIINNFNSNNNNNNNNNNKYEFEKEIISTLDESQIHQFCIQVLLDMIRDLIDNRRISLIEHYLKLLHSILGTDSLHKLISTPISYYDVHHDSNHPFSHTIDSQSCQETEQTQNGSEIFIKGRKVLCMDIICWFVYLAYFPGLRALKNLCPKYGVNYHDQPYLCRLLWRQFLSISMMMHQQHKIKETSSQFESNSINHKSPNSAQVYYLCDKNSSQSLAYQTQLWKHSVIEFMPESKAHYVDKLVPEMISLEKDTLSKSFASRKSNQESIFFVSIIEWISGFRNIFKIPIDQILLFTEENNPFLIERNNSPNNNNNSLNEYNETRIVEEHLQEKHEHDSIFTVNTFFCTGTTLMHLLFIRAKREELLDLFSSSEVIPKQTLSEEPVDRCGRTPLDMIDFPFSKTYQQFKNQNFTTNKNNLEEMKKEIKKWYKTKFRQNNRKLQNSKLNRKRKREWNENDSDEINSNYKQRKKSHYTHIKHCGENEIDIASQTFSNQLDLVSRCKRTNLCRYLDINHIDYASNEETYSLAEKVWLHYSRTRAHQYNFQ